MTRGFQFFCVGIASLACALTAMAQVQIASIGNPRSHILPPSSTYRFPSGEKLTYSVQWHMLNAGVVGILMQRSGSKEHLTSTADSAGLANKLFHVHDIFDADIDARSFCTQEISKHNEEGSRRMDRRIYFDYPHAKSQVDDKDLKTGKQKHSEFDIASRTWSAGFSMPAHFHCRLASRRFSQSTMAARPPTSELMSSPAKKLK